MAENIFILHNGYIKNTAGKTIADCRYSSCNALWMVNVLNSYVEIVDACKKLIMHRNIGDIHPVDFQRIEDAIRKAEATHA